MPLSRQGIAWSGFPQIGALASWSSTLTAPSRTGTSTSPPTPSTPYESWRMPEFRLCLRPAMYAQSPMGCGDFWASLHPCAVRMAVFFGIPRGRLPCFGVRQMSPKRPLFGLPRKLRALTQKASLRTNGVKANGAYFLMTRSTKFLMP